MGLTGAMISAACMQLGERALICTGANDFTHIPHFDHTPPRWTGY